MILGDITGLIFHFTLHLCKPILGQEGSTFLIEIQFIQ